MLAPKRSHIPALSKKHITCSTDKVKEVSTVETPDPAFRSPIRRCISSEEIDSTLHLHSPLTLITENTVSSLAPQIKPIPDLEFTDQRLTFGPAISPKPPSVLSPAPSTPTISLIPAMSTISKGINAMPAPMSNRAPSFSRETSDLLDFFKLFEDLALACGLIDAEKCKLLVRYVDQAMKRFWVTLAGYESKNFVTFKASILEQYPGAEKGVHYTIRDLE
jgi:hypothetical protein